MAKRAKGLHRLTERTVRTAAPGVHGDGGGLWLTVKGGPTGSRSWIHRYTAPSGKRRERGLGPFPVVGLAEARRLAAEGRALLQAGRDPLDVTRPTGALDARFAAVAERYIGKREAGWRNAKHGAQWRMTLTRYCAAFAEVHVAEVGLGHVDDALRPLWLAKPETARRLRARIALVLDFATAEGLRPEALANPARIVVATLPRQNKAQARHHPAVPVAEVPALWDALCASADPVALAVRFQLLTAARPGEVRRARWSEIALVDGVPAWVVPAARMKAGREHRAPLSPAAVAVLELIAPADQRDPDALIFATATGRPLHENSARDLVRELVPGMTAHGLRSSFRDWSEEHDVGGRLAEAALAHVVKDATERAYQRSDLFARRATLMDRWSAYVTSNPQGAGSAQA